MLGAGVVGTQGSVGSILPGRCASSGMAKILSPPPWKSSHLQDSIWSWFPHLPPYTSDNCHHSHKTHTFASTEALVSTLMWGVRETRGAGIFAKKRYSIHITFYGIWPSFYSFSCCLSYKLKFVTSAYA